MRPRNARILEVLMWLVLAGIAFTYGTLVAHSDGKRLPETPEPARFVCTEWATIEQVQEHSGEVLGAIRYCTRVEQ